MDQVELIVAALAALAAGGALTAQDGGGGQHDDAALLAASASLHALVRRRLADRPGAATVLARYAEAPQTWQGPLSAELTAAGAAGDEALVAAAAMVLRLVPRAGPRHRDLPRARTRPPARETAPNRERPAAHPLTNDGRGHDVGTVRKLWHISPTPEMAARIAQGAGPGRGHRNKETR